MAVIVVLFLAIIGFWSAAAIWVFAPEVFANTDVSDVLSLTAILVLAGVMMASESMGRLSR